MRLILTITVLCTLLLIACGGGNDAGSPTATIAAGPERILHLTGFDASETQMAGALFVNMQVNSKLTVPFCTGIQGGSAQDVLKLMDEVLGIAEPVTFQPFQTPRPGQQRSEEDATRVAEIMVTICNTLMSGGTPQAPSNTPAP
jgi:hypothetical protein